MIITNELIQLYYQYVTHPCDCCWGWKVNGALSNTYGNIWINGKNIRAHRISAVMHGKNIPPGMIVRHSCDNPPCTNPNHLIVGTHKENSQDTRNRHRNKQQKLTYDDAIDIKLWTESKECSSRVIAKAYNVSKSTILAIKHNKTWKV